ncbi:MAG: ABC transporter ATP-binding protein [Oligoflexus sp.]
MNTVLAAESLYKNYEQGTSTIKVLSDLNLEVQAGETLAILGRSGSGKSTLLSLLAGLDRPSQGKLKIQGQDLNQLSEAEMTKFRGQNLGIIFQQFHLMNSLTALENVSLPLEILGNKQAKKLARIALERVGLDERRHHLPHQLSGGECQRVAIARAFVVEPKLLLADEPSGNLDHATGKMVMDLLFQAVAERNMTLVLVTHDQKLADRCHRRLTLEQGVLRSLN